MYPCAPSLFRLISFLLRLISFLFHRIRRKGGISQVFRKDYKVLTGGFRGDYKVLTGEDFTGKGGIYGDYKGFHRDYKGL